MNHPIAKLIGSVLLATGLATAVLFVAGCAGDEHRRSTGAYVDDTAISAKVKTELFADKEVKGSHVDVNTYNGVVQLSGFVDSPDKKQRAEVVAKAVPGVRDVIDNLVIKGSGAVEPAGAQPADGNTSNR